MILVVSETPEDAPAIETLLDGAFGPRRYMKTAERLREGRAKAAVEHADSDPSGLLGRGGYGGEYIYRLYEAQQTSTLLALCCHGLPPGQDTWLRRSPEPPETDASRRIGRPWQASTASAPSSSRSCRSARSFHDRPSS